MVRLRRPPLWALVLVILAVLGSVVYASVSTGLINSIINPPDFAISATPASQGVIQGITIARVSLTSHNGFSGTVSLSTTVSPGGSNSPSISVLPSLVTLAPNGDGAANLTISTSNVVVSTKSLTYNITIASHSGAHSHSTTISVTVLTGNGCTPGFICPSSVNPLTISVNQDPTTLHVTSIGVNNHAVYSISLNSYYYTDAYKTQLGNEYAVNTVVGPNTYSTIFSAQPGIQVYGLTMFWQTPPPPPTVTNHSQLNQSWTSTTQQPQEGLSFESFTINSGTNTTLYIRNIGVVPVTFTSYAVNDGSYGDKYSLSSWQGPTINPTVLVSINILIGSSCPSCSLTGNAFTFTTYDNVILTTSRGNQFSTQA